MRPRNLILPGILLILSMVFLYRLNIFLRIFYNHSGASITQEELRDKHFPDADKHFPALGGVANSTRISKEKGEGGVEGVEGKDGENKGGKGGKEGKEGKGNQWGSVEWKDERKELIPRIVHQVFHDWKGEGEGQGEREGGENGEVRLPEDWDTLRKECMKLNQGWDYRLWTTDTSLSFIRDHYPWFLDTYTGYKYPVQRVDTIRYFLLRHYGGIYMDLDNGCLTPLTPLLYTPSFLLSPSSSPSPLQNNILASIPFHPFWILLTDSLIPYNYNYIFPYLTISYASGSWFVSAIWERYHREVGREARDVDGVEGGVGIVRLLVGNGGSGKDEKGGVFWKKGRGGTWWGWDAGGFEWVGDHGRVVGVGGVVVVGLLGWVVWRVVVRRRSTGRARYGKVVDVGVV